MKLEIVTSEKQCLKCGHLRQNADGGPDYACPKCGAIYAKLEAAREAEQAEQAREQKAARDAAIRGEIEDRFDSSRRERNPDEAQRQMMAHAVYLLYALPFALTQVSGLLLAYKMRKPLDESWVNSHFVWQIRTFWYLILPSMVGVIAMLVGGATTSAFVVTHKEGFLSTALNSLYVLVAVAALIIVVYAYRLIRGWYCLIRLEAPG